MKRIFAFVLALLFILPCFCFIFISGCEFPADNNKTQLAESIKYYRDIPGVTEKEITEIEALKETKEKFIYGVLVSTEAFILPDGSYAGFAVKFCSLLSELFGINIVNEFYEWDELLEGLEKYSVDFTGELTPTDERMQIYGMSLPIAERMFRLFTHTDAKKRTESDLSRSKIGFLEGTVTADIIINNSPAQFNIIKVADYEKAAEMIKAGEIDAFIDEAVSDPKFDKYDFIRSEIFSPMMHESVSLTTANSKLYPVISVLNKYLTAGGVDKLFELYREGEFEYAKYKLQKSFTDEEKAYINNLTRIGESVSVGFEHDNYPVNFYNAKEHEFAGIAVDILAEISKLTGIKFESASLSGEILADILEETKAGKIPMIATLLDSETVKSDFILSAVPYSRSYFAIMSKTETPNMATYQVVHYPVGVLKKSGHEDIYRELFPDNNNLIGYDTFEECLDALEKDEVELLMASEHMLLAQTNYREKTGYKINIRLNAPMDSYFGFNKNETVLCSIINKAQQYVNCEMIETNWTGMTFDYTRKIFQDRAVFFSVFAGVLSVVLLGIVLLLISLIRLSQKLKALASNDSLTNIFNRRYFMELAEMQTEKAHRTGIDCFLAIFDLDYFKAVNDNYGHQAGDAVLREIAKRVKKLIRRYDLLGRYGGEEFILFMSDIKEIKKENVINVMERIRHEISHHPVEYNGMKISVTASFGVAYASPRNALEPAIKFADEALYTAKKSGRNKVVFNDDSSGEILSEGEEALKSVEIKT